MTAEWREVQLGDVADLLTGYPFKSQHYSDDQEDPRVLGGDNIIQGALRWDSIRRWPRRMVEGLDGYWLRRHDVVLAMDRPWIEAGLKHAAIGAADLPALLVQRTARLRGTDQLDSGFLRYVIGSRGFTQHVVGVQTGTAVPHISPSQIKEFRFKLPPVPVQQAIAHILGTLDDKIELNRRMSETLEAMARALFKSWFVDFLPVRAKQRARTQTGDPVRAKAEGRLPAAPGAAQAGDAGLPKDVSDLFPNSFQDSELGEIPKGWGIGTVGDLAASIYSGGTPSTQNLDYWGGEIPWLSSGETREKFIIGTEKKITESGVLGSSTRLAPALSTVIASAGQGNTRGQTSPSRI